MHPVGENIRTVLHKGLTVMGELTCMREEKRGKSEEITCIVGHSVCRVGFKSIRSQPYFISLVGRGESVG